MDTYDRKNSSEENASQEASKKLEENPVFGATFAIINRITTIVETFLFFLMNGYDDYVYSPLQKCLSPIVKMTPRNFHYGDTKFPVFTANIVTLSRVFLVIPIAWFLKYDYNLSAFMCVVFHDFLDHLDGIVAKVHRVTYPDQDSPLLGGFLDAFCDKIVNVLAIWTILQYTNFSNTGNFEFYLYLTLCYAVIGYETVIGVIRVQDYFLATFKQNYNIQDSEVKETDPVKVTAASMEGKLKEKLESTGIALLCMGIGKFNSNPLVNGWSIAGMICLLLTLRMAHKSLVLKLEARKSKRPIALTRQMSSSTDDLLHLLYQEQESMDTSNKSDDSNYENAEMKMVDYGDNEFKDQSTNFMYKRPKNNLMRSSSLLSVEKIDTRVDKVFTVGCFDLFHHGHVTLINRMREIGKKVIIGVHDSRSIYKLKKRVPVDSTEKRMLNVKAEADEVFCISGTDPSNFMTCIVNLAEGETAVYVRGDDMKDFPSRDVVENLMPIKFLPYTKGVSTTQLRKKNYAHIAPDDFKHLERIN